MSGDEYSKQLIGYLTAFKNTYLEAQKEGFYVQWDVATGLERKRIQCYDELQFFVEVSEHKSWAISTLDKETE